MPVGSVAVRRTWSPVSQAKGWHTVITVQRVRASVQPDDGTVMPVRPRCPTIAPQHWSENSRCSERPALIKAGGENAMYRRSAILGGDNGGQIIANERAHGDRHRSGRSLGNVRNDAIAVGVTLFWHLGPPIGLLVLLFALGAHF